MPPRVSNKDPKQGELNLLVDRQIEADGIGMGVLRDGTPFLNQRGLARLCGVENRYIGLISSEWNSAVQSERTRKVREILADRGETASVAAYETFFGKRKVLAYPDTVCMAILEYYAFEVELSGQAIAKSSFRTLARHGLKQFIYNRVGYNYKKEDDVWKIFKDRVGLTYDAVPIGFFGIFKEISSLIITLGLSGLHIDENFVPDISVGQAWARYWSDMKLSSRYGDRGTYLHHYPQYFPQAASNPQVVACYPEEALGVFRKWFREEYIGEGRFKKYLTKKFNERLLPEGYVERAMIALMK